MGWVFTLIKCISVQFRIADTFTASLARLPNDQQRAAKTTAFDLQTNIAHPSLSLHRVTGARDPGFWSARVNLDLRIILHRSGENVVLCYVDSHDDAYRWAERRRLETHSTTGAAQLVELREVVQEVVVPVYVEAEQTPPPKPAVFARISDDQLLGYGVPEEWLDDVRVATEDSVLDLADHLPGEAAEALLELAVGKTPQPSLPFAVGGDPFSHPDALRRFRVMNNVEELAEALEYPWERWTVFLHPDQSGIVERNYNGPARVCGSAGTGKTVVALHHAAFLAKSSPDGRVLLTTFSDTLANLLKAKLRLLVHQDQQTDERISVDSLDTVASRLYESKFGPGRLARQEIIEALVKEAASIKGTNFSATFLLTEWDRVVDSWQLDTWEDYRDVNRIGRYRRLSETQRKVVWPVFERVRSGLQERGLLTKAQLFGQLTREVLQQEHPPFDHVVVDEAQDVSVAQLRFLAALAGGRPNGLFFAGDLGQRIFQQPFSWKELGVEIRGRSQTLKINYRTSHQIRTYADRLLGPEMSDVDGNLEERKGTVSVFNGPLPTIHVLEDEDSECDTVSMWLSARISEGLQLGEVSVFVRSVDQICRAIAAVELSGLPYTVLDYDAEAVDGVVAVGTMHLAKGLEFRAAAVMACDSEVIPLQSRVESITDEADLEEVYNTERNLLYVACTRARDHLLVTGVEPASEFLDDLKM